MGIDLSPHITCSSNTNCEFLPFVDPENCVYIYMHSVINQPSSKQLAQLDVPGTQLC